MASELQRRKIARVFQAMDVDGDGYLREADFEALSTRWTGLRGWAPGSPGYARLNTIMMGWWSALRLASDTEGADRIDIEDVLRLVDRLPSMSDSMAAT